MDKICKLTKVVEENNKYNFYFRVTGIGAFTHVFNRLYEAEKYIADRGYRYNYYELIVDEM